MTLDLDRIQFWRVVSAGLVARLVDQVFCSIYDGSRGFIELFAYWQDLLGFNQGMGSYSSTIHEDVFVSGLGLSFQLHLQVPHLVGKGREEEGVQ